MAANLTGWSAATARAAVSPTKIWNGVRIAAGTNPSREAGVVVAVPD
jgi:hypothetical protein